MSDKIVFRSDKPEVLDAFHEAADKRVQWSKDILKFAKSVHPDAKPMVGTTWGEERFDGLSLVDPLPDGWRVVKQKRGEDYMVPKVSLKVGKEWSRVMEPLKKAPHVRGSLPGMPSCGFGSNMTLYNPGIEELDGALYVTWSEHPESLDLGWSRNNEKFNGDLWDVVKLSEYYAAKERLEEAAS